MDKESSHERGQRYTDNAVRARIKAYRESIPDAALLAALEELNELVARLDERFGRDVVYNLAAYHELFGSGVDRDDIVKQEPIAPDVEQEVLATISHFIDTKIV